jgi:hypothetical protein
MRRKTEDTASLRTTKTAVGVMTRLIAGNVDLTPLTVRKDEIVREMDAGAIRTAPTTKIGVIDSEREARVWPKKDTLSVGVMESAREPGRASRAPTIIVGVTVRAAVRAPL